MNSLIKFISSSFHTPYRMEGDEPTAIFDTLITDVQDSITEHNFFQDDQEYFNPDAYIKEIYQEILQEEEEDYNNDPEFKILVLEFRNNMHNLIDQLSAEKMYSLSRLVKMHEFLNFLLLHTVYWKIPSYHLFRDSLFEKMKDFMKELEQFNMYPCMTHEISKYMYDIIAAISQLNMIILDGNQYLPSSV